ncbi:MAG: hypothetical protein UY50_C0016G0012 [Parcubacteria group bacterium GW2011_GWA2_49_9]|nr:MAG: hypothetical protein UY50_C0016G0012 [Parcubacteria group bacterium GW2011_GWA2_49_9]
MEPKRYGPEKLPRSLSEATERIRVLGADIHEINKQLRDNITRNGFPGSEEWRVSAHAAKRFMEQEKSFLEDWKKKQHLTKVITDGGLDVDSEYEVMFNQNNPPPDITVAEERRLVLTELKRKCEALFGELKSKSIELGAKPPLSYFQTRQKVVALKGQAETEISFLSLWIKRKHSEKDTGEVGMDSPEEMLRVLVLIIAKQIEAGKWLDQEDFRVFSKIQTWVEHH